MLDLGELLIDLGEFAPAGEKFRQVLELSPEEPTALFHLGNVALGEAKLPEALECFRRVLKSDRTFPGAHLRIAHIYLKQNKPTEAIFHANCELAQQTNDEHTLLELGNTFVDLNQMSPAEVTFRRVLEANPQNAAARHNLGVLLLKSGRVDEGIEQERKALRALPKYMLAMHNLALAYLMKKDVTRARFWLREAMDIAPDDQQLRQLHTKLRFAHWAATARKVMGRLRRK
jgi:tetratricopeptide (TPR) repeat protein